MYKRQDLAFRIGGEEFLLLLPQSNADDTRAKMDDLRQQVAQELRIAHGSLRLSGTIPIGGAAFPVHGKNLDELLKAADSAMYQAKAAGRNRVHLSGQ